MLDFSAVFDTLDAEGLGDWVAPLEPIVAGRFADGAHGNLREWRAALDQLPDIERAAPVVSAGAVATAGQAMAVTDEQALRGALLRLRPWRKGPFRIGNLDIDAEWQSNRKWERIESMLSPLGDRLVLDVGCGNGYYAMRMHLAGARAVVGIDPTLLYVIQFLSLSRFFTPLPVTVLPLRLDDLPERSRAFDSAFSMGVLYHQRAPIDHLRQLRDALRPGGELVLETLILPGDQPLSRTPEDRYARMRNVWHLPSLPELKTWLQRAGFTDLVTGPAVATSTSEQRSTEWMPFESLADALDPADPSQTVEGWPAPVRAVIVCRVP